jgi:hypothetical protein
LFSAVCIELDQVNSSAVVCKGSKPRNDPCRPVPQPSKSYTEVTHPIMESQQPSQPSLPSPPLSSQSPFKARATKNSNDNNTPSKSIPGSVGLDLLGNVFSRGRNEIRTLSSKVGTNLQQQQSKFQQGETQLQVTVRTLGSKLGQPPPPPRPGGTAEAASASGGGGGGGGVQEGLRSIGTKLQQLNLAKLIDSMEQDQSLADNLESLNARLKEDKEFHDIRRQAEEACLSTMRTHLEDFVVRNYHTTNNNENHRPLPTYEQWIENLHPENAHDGKLLAGLEKEIDLRFYLEESDHLQLWNARVPERYVTPRNRMKRPITMAPATTIATTMEEEDNHHVDLLSGGHTPTAMSTTTTTFASSTTDTATPVMMDDIFATTNVITISSTDPHFGHDDDPFGPTVLLQPLSATSLVESQHDLASIFGVASPTSSSSSTDTVPTEDQNSVGNLIQF